MDNGDIFKDAAIEEDAHDKALQEALMQLKEKLCLKVWCP